ncbi:hypothetical protein GMORB2_3604 [Geosmithia morbida]|uniref:MARVEL domain-containing protein n=1 Tax=Geosmithia morbida TaxID=1094350 RepID=A0A9P4YMX9_9HYPO|nr:uncharacterized protein GMORB2_3604 [Geosmithia morbida]KAF4119916.1 hypothetical protein GMORB2_3604 [Geosmithia morbida]
MAISLVYIFFTALHFLCFALGITVCGVYGQNLKDKGDHESRWIYAVVVGALSVVTCLVYSIPFVLRLGGLFKTAWDLVLFILWIAVFGLFADMYLHKDNKNGDSDIRLMKDAIWVDLVNAILWLIAAVADLGYWFKHRDVRTRFTGRATV